MADCCSSTSETKQKKVKHNCVVCGQKSLLVPVKTMLHHIKQVWEHKFSDQPFYYCHNPECEVVYFSQDAITIKTADIRTPIGIKQPAENALICYCFGVSKKEAASSKKVKAFVIEQTKQSMCSCETANPSGRCCLKDFPKGY